MGNQSRTAREVRTFETCGYRRLNVPETVNDGSGASGWRFFRELGVQQEKEPLPAPVDHHDADPVEMVGSVLVLVFGELDEPGAVRFDGVVAGGCGRRGSAGSPPKWRLRRPGI
jgi:hypothetical protein